VCVCVAWGIQSGGVRSIGFNLSLYLESRATPVISASIFIRLRNQYTRCERTCRKLFFFTELLELIRLHLDAGEL
jgi:hypothetical protein